MELSTYLPYCNSLIERVHFVINLLFSVLTFLDKGILLIQIRNWVLATNLLGNKRIRSSLRISKELLIMGLSSLVEELYPFNFGCSANTKYLGSTISQSKICRNGGIIAVELDVR